MTIWNNLPDEIKDKIYYYKYFSEHNCKFKHILDDLLINIGKLTGQRYLSVVYELYPVTLNNDDYIHLFNLLNKCMCCSRHIVKRPGNIYDYKNFIGPHQTKYHTCKCTCRHYMRIITRIVRHNTNLVTPQICSI